MGAQGHPPGFGQRARGGQHGKEAAAEIRPQHESERHLRRDHAGEVEPRSVQILGADPRAMAEAARFNADQGAQLIDLNMGCPARKVCGAQAGSALLRDEALVGRILEAVVAAVTIPVTLKIRTGWDRTHRNGVAIARIAEQAGIQALAVHGRTRACGYSGDVDYAGIRDTVILLAYASRIECWDAVLYEHLLSDEPADFARLAEEIMGGAGHAGRDEERFPDFRESPLPPGSRH